ncbi:MAG: hypothetical protein MI924_25405 [Chloroflexales bacterium]|nr:hypothetical protein [Chloroflexales bacterium]
MNRRLLTLSICIVMIAPLLVGCGGDTQDRIKVGMIAQLSGAASFLRPSEEAAARIAVEEINCPVTVDVVTGMNNDSAAGRRNLNLPNRAIYTGARRYGAGKNGKIHFTPIGHIANRPVDNHPCNALQPSLNSR